LVSERLTEGPRNFFGRGPFPRNGADAEGDFGLAG
jgi:hypothetical protein